jgi:hypothetical protein
VHTEGTTLLAVEWWHNGGTMYNIIDVLFLLVGLINDNLITEPTQPGFPNVFLKWPYVFLLWIEWGYNAGWKWLEYITLRIQTISVGIMRHIPTVLFSGFNMF